MKVYAAHINYEKFADLLFKKREVASYFYDHTSGKILAPEWERFDVIKSVGADGLTTSTHPIGDFSLLEGSGRNPTLSNRARLALTPQIVGCGEFLPLAHAAETRWLFNCTRLLAALDIENSVVSRFTDGRIMHLRGPLYFKPELLVNEWIFMPAERPAEIFVTDKFVKVVEDHELTGFDFHEIWDSNDKPPAQKPNDPALMTRHDLN